MVDDGLSHLNDFDKAEEQITYAETSLFATNAHKLSTDYQQSCVAHHTHPSH